MKLDELINKYYKYLNKNDLYIWNYISKNQKECEGITIDQLAYKCDVLEQLFLDLLKNYL